LEGIEPNREKIEEYVRNSLMLVTALNPHIGYEKASRVAGLAYRENLSLREAVVRLGVLSEEEFDEMVRPDLMTGPNL
ncbi:MAG: class II fumarate hydratase, partial [Spirochaetia bacterium]